MFYKQNSYKLRTEEIKGITYHFVSFVDGAGKNRETQVSRPVYLEFERFVRQDNSQARQSRRYIEQSELTDQNLYDRALHKPKSVEEAMIEKLESIELKRAIAELPTNMKKRFVLYHIFGLTRKQIAEIEGCKRQSVDDSVRNAEKKIREKLKIDLPNSP